MTNFKKKANIDAEVLFLKISPVFQLSEAVDQKPTSVLSWKIFSPNDMTSSRSLRILTKNDQKAKASPLSVFSSCFPLIDYLFPRT